jgi:hypothetical protein
MISDGQKRPTREGLVDAELAPAHRLREWHFVRWLGLNDHTLLVRTANDPEAFAGEGRSYNLAALRTWSLRLSTKSILR